MDFGRNSLSHELKRTGSSARKFGTASALLILKICLVAVIFAGVLAAACVVGAARGIIDESPVLTNIDVSPKGLATTIYDADGNEIQTLIGSGANRSLINYSQLPEDLIDAFVAIEDARFWTHEGIDIKGIFRAGIIGLTSGRFSEGASTITQQLIKNNVFEGGEEKTTGARFVRKIQEQTLALQLERAMTKEKILENYLNTINLGSNCLGVQKAAERYFGKGVEELTLSECAVIAAITQNPYGYNPIRFPEKNALRREKVLNNMEEMGKITAEEKSLALADPVYQRIAETDRNRDTSEAIYTYFVDRLIHDVLRDLEASGYTSDQAQSMLYSGGLKIYTTQDPAIQTIVDEEVENEANYQGVSLKYSFSYSLRVSHADNTYTDYSTTNVRKFTGSTYLEYDSKEEIDQVIRAFKSSVMSATDKVTSEKLNITLQPQVSVVVMDQSTGYVKAITGGRGEKTASLSLNRATNTFRQPGSTFKVLASFAPAIDACGDTLATTFYDEPYTTEIDGTPYSPKNWYSSKKYAGYANIHQAITYSMNVVAVRCLAEDVTPGLGYSYVERFGINTLIPKTEENAVTGLHDERATLALGGITQGVTNLQLTGAYAAIANQGTYVEPILYTRIEDNNGKVILNNEPESRQVLKESTAFLLTTAMASSLEDTRLNGLFSSSSPQAKLSDLPAAGKSGTTSSYNDLWFVGYTPYYTCGIWSGFDDNAKFESEDNRDFHKVIWHNIMEQITVNLPHAEFPQPDNMVKVTICNKSGKLATEACLGDERNCIVSEEYFLKGTEPAGYCDLHYRYEVCSVSNLLPSPNCTATIVYKSGIKLPSDVSGDTQDTLYSVKPTDFCNICLPIDPLNPDGTVLDPLSGLFHELFGDQDNSDSHTNEHYSLRQGAD